MSMTPMHSEKYTLSIVAPLKVREEWRVSMNQARDPEFSFAQENQAGFSSFTFRSAFSGNMGRFSTSRTKHQEQRRATPPGLNPSNGA